MFFRQIYDDGLAQASYVVGSSGDGRALVVDPCRDVDVYLELAAQKDLQIVAVAETHIHADFLSGAPELARVTGATLQLSGEGRGPHRVETFQHALRTATRRRPKATSAS